MMQFFKLGGKFGPYVFSFHSYLYYHHEKIDSFQNFQADFFTNGFRSEVSTKDFTKGMALLVKNDLQLSLDSGCKDSGHQVMCLAFCVDVSKLNLLFESNT